MSSQSRTSYYDPCLPIEDNKAPNTPSGNTSLTLLEEQSSSIGHTHLEAKLYDRDDTPKSLLPSDDEYMRHFKSFMAFGAARATSDWKGMPIYAGPKATLAWLCGGRERALEPATSETSTPPLPPAAIIQTASDVSRPYTRRAHRRDQRRKLPSTPYTVPSLTERLGLPVVRPSNGSLFYDAYGRSVRADPTPITRVYQKPCHIRHPEEPNRCEGLYFCYFPSPDSPDEY